MKKVAALFAGILVLVLALAACPAPTPATPKPTTSPTPTATTKPSPTIVGTFTDETKPVNVKVGEQFAIALESNPSTGFGWTAKTDSRYLVQVSKDFSSGSATPMPGAGGTDRFIFITVQPGTVDLTFTYARSFDPPTTAPASTKVFKVIIVK
jgi:predicted secreted protein